MISHLIRWLSWRWHRGCDLAWLSPLDLHLIARDGYVQWRRDRIAFWESARPQYRKPPAASGRGRK